MAINRFSIPEYIIFSLKLRWQEKNLIRKSKGKSPFETFKNEAQVRENKYPHRKIEKYEALTHFNYQEACDFYGGLDFITTLIIKALIYWNEENREDAKFLDLIEKIVARGEEDETTLSFRLPQESTKYQFVGRFVSGITQGKALSLLVRVYWLTGEQRYFDLAKKCFNTLSVKVEDGGAFREIGQKGIWVEEYPDKNRPSMVLNGHLFTIIGLADYMSVVHNENIETFYQKVVNTTLAFLPFYIQGNVLLYSMYNWKPCNIHYLGIMQPLCRHTYLVTESKEFQGLEDWLVKHCPQKTFKKLLGINR